jgi:hypothetical protein
MAVELSRPVMLKRVKTQLILNELRSAISMTCSPGYKEGRLTHYFS